MFCVLGFHPGSWKETAIDPGDRGAVDVAGRVRAGNPDKLWTNPDIFSLGPYSGVAGSRRMGREPGRSVCEHSSSQGLAYGSRSLFLDSPSRTSEAPGHAERRSSRQALLKEHTQSAGPSPLTHLPLLPRYEPNPLPADGPRTVGPHPIGLRARPSTPSGDASRLQAMPGAGAPPASPGPLGISCRPILPHTAVRPCGPAKGHGRTFGFWLRWVDDRPNRRAGPAWPNGSRTGFSGQPGNRPPCPGASRTHPVPSRPGHSSARSREGQR